MTLYPAAARLLQLKCIHLSTTCADIKSANQRQRNERLNRSLQNFLYGCIAHEGDAAAKPALAVLTELWRRHVWRDARTANVIGGQLPTYARTAPMNGCCCCEGSHSEGDPLLSFSLFLHVRGQRHLLHPIFSRGYSLALVTACWHIQQASCVVKGSTAPAAPRVRNGPMFKLHAP